MRRQIVTGFIIWLGFTSLLVLAFVYFLALPLDGVLVQLVILGSLICLNFLYLFFLLAKADLAMALIFTAIFSSGSFFYHRLFRQIDPRLQSVHILLALIALTIIVRLVLKKSSAG